MSADLRRAALRIHGLSGEDRAWVLARLEPAQRGDVESLLAELGEIGVPRAFPGEAVSQHAEPRDTPLRRLDGVDAARVAGTLRGLPDALLPSLLACHDWSWRRELLESRPRRSRSTLLRSAGERRRSLSAATRRTLVDAVLEAVEDGESLADPAPTAARPVAQTRASRRRRWRR